MAKAKTLPKPKKSSANIKSSKKQKDSLKPIPDDPLKNLLDKKFIGEAILECLRNNDPEGVIEVISIYLETVNIAKSAEKTDLSRSTLYHSLKKKNPTL